MSADGTKMFLDTADLAISLLRAVRSLECPMCGQTVDTERLTGNPGAPTLAFHRTPEPDSDGSYKCVASDASVSTLLRETRTLPRPAPRPPRES